MSTRSDSRQTHVSTHWNFEKNFGPFLASVYCGICSVKPASNSADVLANACMLSSTHAAMVHCCKRTCLTTVWASPQLTTPPLAICEVAPAPPSASAKRQTQWQQAVVSTYTVSAASCWQGQLQLAGPLATFKVSKR